MAVLSSHRVLKPPETTILWYSHEEQLYEILVGDRNSFPYPEVNYKELIYSLILHSADHLFCILFIFLSVGNPLPIPCHEKCKRFPGSHVKSKLTQRLPKQKKQTILQKFLNCHPHPFFHKLIFCHLFPAMLSTL